MAVSVGRVTVTTVPTAINSEDSSNGELTVLNLGSQVYLGGSDVTVATGFPLGAGQRMTIRVDALDVLYAVHETGTSTIAVLRS